MTQVSQANRAHVAAAALEAVGRLKELRSVGGLFQQLQALFGICEKGIHQDRILALHDLLQRAKHVRVEMFVCHLLTP
jgi:hypothetical protein